MNKISTATAVAPNDASADTHWDDQLPVKVKVEQALGDYVPLDTKPPSSTLVADLHTDVEQALTTDASPSRRLSRPVIYPLDPAPPNLGDHTETLQQWEGVVIEILQDSFVVRLGDLTNEMDDEEAEIPLDEVSAGDIELIAPGAIFYWHIGYYTSAGGQRTRTSDIRFRRLPSWRAEDIAKVNQEAESIAKTIGWE